MMMMMKNDMFTQFGSVFTTALFLWALYHQYLPYHVRESIEYFFTRHSQKLANFLSPYLYITFDEYTDDYFDRSEIYTNIENYLSESSSMKARRLKANSVKDGKSLILSMADNEEVTDEYKGVKLWWASDRSFSTSQIISFFPGRDEKRFYRLAFHRQHRDLITSSYLNYVMEQGKAIAIRKRRRRLFTNTSDSDWHGYGSRSTMWSRVEFKHPGRFETLAMEPMKKQQIIDDLKRFSNAKDYYEKIGKPWKRGYLLYGPPGTGKSTMIAAIANLLEYDVYDLELTAVKDNIQLRRLLIETTSKSIIVIEDIDCSLDLTGQRKKKQKADAKEEGDPLKKILIGEEKKGSEVTLSGLLNFIDGIWSACGEERLIVFTTNFIEKLDPALIRRGRMDLHIELSYCGFEAFKMLARNYLDLDSHDLFPTVGRLLEETDTTPADVAEHLMPKSSDMDVDVCLENLVKALEKAKEEAKLKAEEERKLKEKEAEEKQANDAEIAEEKKTSADESKEKEENNSGQPEKK